MARWSNDMGLWRRRPLTIPPDSLRTWLQLAAWEMWMGMLLSAAFAIGLRLIVTSPQRIVRVLDLSNCYVAPPVPLPCEQYIYRGGTLNAAFNVLCGVMLVGVAAWFLWELWRAVEPKPITDDFLKLLHDSFARSWRNPLTWPWARVFLAYGFTVCGAALAATAAFLIWTTLTAPASAKAPTIRVETSQSFRAK